MGLFDNLIEPEEDPVNKDVNNEGNIPQQDSENEESQNKNNIQPEESKPESPTKEGNIQPEETDTEQTERESIPVSENAPDPPQRSGNIQPSEFDPEDQSESNISPDEDRPVDAPQRRRNIRPDEENRPDNPNRIPFQSKEDAKPEEPSGSQIETEESKPSNPQKRGNIKPTEEPPSTEPMDESDLEVSATGQENVGSEGNIKPQEENAPNSPNREENISPDPENRPLGPQFSGNIEPDEENKPSSPSTEGNVTPTEESEPSSPNRQENISPDEESSPSSPSTEGNIKSEESQPSGPAQTGNIVPNEDATPESPSRVGNISPREQNTPPAPNRDGSINPAENQPDSPSREDNIEADKKKPKSPRIEDNINEEDRRPEAPQLEQNINPTNGENTDGIAGQEIDREQPLKFQPENYASQIDPETAKFTDEVAAEFIGSTDGVEEWEVPLRHQPNRFSNQINPEDTEFVDVVAGSEDGVPEWETPLKYQPPNRFADQIDPTAEETRDGIGSVFPGEGDNLEEWEVAPLRHNPNSPHEIDPSNEGGRYQLKEFVTGSNEPGDNVRDMTYDKGGAVEDLRHQPPEIVAKLRESTIINPDDEGGRYQLERFVTGSDEPGDNIRDMKYDKSGGAQDLRHQPPEIISKLRDSTIINPDDEGGRYQLEEFVAESDEPGGDIRDMAYGFEGSSEALRHQTAVKFALNNNIIDPSFEGGRYLDEKFVTGSDEPGDDIRDMEYDVEGVFQSPRHVKKFYKFALENYIIDPSFEGGAYLSPKFVAGSDEPGDNLRNMKYTVEGSVAKLRHQTAVKNALTNGIIDPSFEGGNYLIPKFVAGSNEPGDNVRDMAYTVGGATEDLRFQPDEITSKLRSSTVIDPADDGGRYQLQEFVVGIDEPGDQLPEFQPAPFNAETSHSSQNNGPVLNPAFNTGQQKKDEIETQNQRVSELDRNASPDSDGAIQFQPFRQTDIGRDPQAPKQNRYQPPGFEASPFLPEFTDGIGGSFPDSENAVIEANEPRTSQTRFSGSIEELNRTVRLREFNEKFEDGKNNFSLFDSPATLQGNAGAAAEPFILRRPESGGGSAAIANIKQSDSRIAPTGSAAEDTVRMSKFFSTAKGLVYNVKQQFLQTQNPRKRTKLYDPTAPVQTAGSGMAIRPGQEITRHLGADSGPAGIVGDAAEAIGSAVGFDVPKSSRYEDEIQEEARQTEWGEMSGSLFWLSPVATSGLPDVSGSEAQNVVAQTRSENVRNIKQLFSTEENEQLSKFAASSLASRGGIGNGYLFTNTYDPQGGPNSNGTVRTDNYHPSSPYLANAETTGSRFDANSSSYNGPDFNENYIKLAERSNSDRDNKGSYFPYANPDGSPAQDSVVDGDGNVQAQIQNDSTSEVYFENRTFRSRTPVHRGVPNQEKSRGIPNYSLQNEDGQKEKRIDWINRLEPIVGKDADPDKEAYGRDGRHEDFIPFKFYDIPNEGSLVFRAFLEGISDNLSPEWSQTDYAGRPEQGHKYGGYSNTISFSFQLVPFSREEFKALWKKVNYLKGLTTPASYSKPEGGGGGYMTPPFMRLTIGDMFNDVYGYMNSLTISVNDDVPYEIDKDLGRLPRGLEIDVDWQVIPKRAPLALQKYYDAPFLEEVDNPIRESPDPRPPVELPTSDAESSEYSPRDRNGTDTGRANELSSAPPEGTDGIDNTPSPEDITDNIPNNPL